jgi:hypothetical protein
VLIADARSGPNDMIDTPPELRPKPISELVIDPDFPGSAVGETVDIKGYTGVVMEIVKNSIKVRSAEGNTVSYNFHTLRKLYSPRTAPEPVEPEPPPATPAASQTQAKREIILEPNFDSPLTPIESVVHRPDFPKCAFGLHIDLHGYAGVVVELVGASLKVRSREGPTRSYNADSLRTIYGKPSSGGPPTTG